jgi:histone H3/H4
MTEMTDAEVRSLVVASKVKDVIKEKGLQTSGEAIEALNKRVLALVEEAISRAQANKRATVKAQDL